MNSGKDVFKDYLKKHNLKFTPQREVIFAAILSFKKHFDVDDLYTALRKKNKNISIATVYRILPFLIDCKLISENFICQGKANYEYIYKQEHHDHLFCIKCGRIIEFKDERIEKLQEEVCKKNKFKPIKHKLVIKGYCKKCK